MDDLISRKQAIDILAEREKELDLYDVYGSLAGACSGAAKLIETLPSVEPNEIIHMDDLISRKQAIDILAEREKELDLYDVYGNLSGACSDDAELIATLPSVKPNEKIHKELLNRIHSLVVGMIENDELSMEFRDGWFSGMSQAENIINLVYEQSDEVNYERSEQIKI